MNILPTKGKTSKYRKRIKLFGVSKKRRLKNSWKEKVIKERKIKFVGKISKPSEFILSLKKKRTSPKTLKIQKAKTAQCQAVLLWDSSKGPYIKSEQQ